jgi:replicative DNA helicase
MEWAFESIEDNILTLLIKDREFTVIVIDELKKEYFSNRTYEKIFSIIKSYFREYGDLPGLNEIKSIVGSSKKLSKDFDFIETERIFNNIELKQSEIDYIRDVVPKFIKHNNFKTLIMTAATEISTLDNPELQEDMLDKFSNKLSDIRNFDMNKDLGHNIYDVEGRYARLKNKYTGGIKPKLEGLKNVIKGFFKGESYAYMGDTGSGKSIMLANEALNAMRQGFNVAFISLELEPEQFGLRMDQNVSKKESGELIKDKETVKYLKKKYADIKKLEGAGDMWIKEYPNGTISCMSIKDYVELLRIQKNFVVDFLVVDYLDILKPNEGRTGNDYSDQARVANEFDALAKTLDLPLLSAMQTNRGSKEDTGPINKNRIADSYGKLRPLYGVYSINSKKDDGEILNKHFLFLVKNRNGPEQIKVNFLMNKIYMSVDDDFDQEEEEDL